MANFGLFLLFSGAFLVFLLPESCSGKKVHSYLLNKPRCTEKEMRKIELTIARVISIGPHGREFPENIPQLKGFCKETNQLVSHVEAFFKECYAKNIRDYANVLIFSIRNSLRKYCASKRSKVVKDLISVAHCANTRVRLQVPCMDRFINSTAQLIPLSGNEIDQMKIPQACCNFVETLNCASHFMDSIPCIRDQKETIIDFIRGLSNSITDIFCGEYNDQTDKCDSLKKPPKPRSKSKARYVTFAFVLIDLLESIKNFNSPL